MVGLKYICHFGFYHPGLISNIKSLYNSRDLRVLNPHYPKRHQLMNVLKKMRIANIIEKKGYFYHVKDNFFKSNIEAQLQLRMPLELPINNIKFNIAEVDLYYSEVKGKIMGVHDYKKIDVYHQLGFIRQLPKVERQKLMNLTAMGEQRHDAEGMYEDLLFLINTIAGTSTRSLSFKRASDAAYHLDDRELAEIFLWALKIKLKESKERWSNDYLSDLLFLERLTKKFNILLGKRDLNSQLAMTGIRALELFHSIYIRKEISERRINQSHGKAVLPQSLYTSPACVSTITNIMELIKRGYNEDSERFTLVLYSGKNIM